jgi:phosphohistidine swiveling domain-containing protein
MALGANVKRNPWSYTLLPLLSLDDIEPGDRRNVGGKALHLARMHRAGMPVPPAIVIPVAAFERALRHAGLMNRAREVGRSGDLSQLSEAIATLDLPPGWSEQMVSVGKRLGARLAIRSSGVEEDGGLRTFAGQFESVIGVSPAGVPDAVRRCWASLYAGGAAAYRGRGGPMPGGLAVVVQVLISPRCSGVLFTVNPLNGSWREMVVESVWGLGEGLVSGQIAPHWYVVRRPRRGPRRVQRAMARIRLQVMQEDLPVLERRWCLDERGRVSSQPVPEPLRKKRTLGRSALFRLCRLGLKAEGLLGEPQDVEWVLDEAGVFHVVQARPITTTGTPRVRTDVLYTRRFIGERWPEPTTPMGWSIMGPLFEWFIAYPETQARYLGGGPALKLVRSRPYLNTTVFRHLAFKFPGAPPPGFMLELVPQSEEMGWRRRHAVRPDFSVYGSILKTTWKERRWERFSWNPFTNHRQWSEVRDQLDAQLEDVSDAPSTAAEAVELVNQKIGFIRTYIGVHVCSLLFANLWYQVLEACLASWVPSRSAFFQEHLAVCPPGNKTMETNAALWRLAKVATEADFEALERGQIPDTFTEFFEVFGARSDASWELMSPRWRHDPQAILPLLRAQGGPDPKEREAAQEEAFEEAWVQLRRAVPTGWRRVALEGLIPMLREYLLLRENQRFWFDTLLFSTQQTVLGLGSALTQDGILTDPSDIAYLTWPEVQGIVGGSLTTEAVSEWVSRRRLQREADVQAETPVFLVGDLPGPLDDNGGRLQGLGISPGRVRGRVRILRRLADGEQIQAGEILVARAVDPGWTPLFVAASGLILEMGSVLSHGAVVAREYKIPAVVNIDGVMRRLQDGDEVTIDGTRGVVWLHP